MASKAAPPSTAPSTPPMIAPTFFDLAVLRTIVDGVGVKTESAPKELATLLLDGVLVEEAAEVPEDTELGIELSEVRLAVGVVEKGSGNVELETVLLSESPVVSKVEEGAELG